MATTTTRTPRGAVEDWRNWAGDQACRPAEVLRPRTRDELAEAVRANAEAGRRVSVPGSGHSFTEAAMTAETMIRIEALNDLQEADPSSGLVRVGAGIVLADLNERLHGLGLALENLGDIDRQTIAGAISTATHGTGASLRNISAQVEAIEIVLADGSVRELTPDSEPDLLRAARVGVGALGAISAVTLRCVPAFTLHRIDEPRPLDDVLALVRGAGRGQRPLRVLRLPLHREGADDQAQPHRARAAAPRPDAALPRRRGAGERRRRPDAAPRPPPPGADPPRHPAGGAADVPGRAPRSQLPDLRQPPHDPLHRDGVRDPARATGRRRCGGCWT